jgi:hypothetical protein
VDIDSTHTPIRTAQSTQTVSSLSGYAAGRAWVNPVQIVRWEITGPGGKDVEPAQYVNALDNQPLSPTTQDPNKYDLMRTFVDATGVLVPETSEIVAEYAVDLDFAFTVETGTSAAQPALVTYGFDNASANNLWAKDVSTAAYTPGSRGPQRIRAVRMRLVTRAEQPDRTTNVGVTTQNGVSNENVNEEFLFRYCVVAPCPNPPDRTLRWARARTITAEVRLPNLARSY